MEALLLNRKLLHFVSVFESGNIARAAGMIGISQPALSMSLRQLEEEYGTALFHRQPRGVAPTAAGEVLYRHAISIRQGARLAREEIAAMGADGLSRLRLGAGVAWTTTMLPDVLVALQAQFPGMTIDMITGVGDQLAGLFLAGEIDVFLAAGSIPALNAPEIKTEFVANLPMRAVADSDHALARMERVTPSDLAAWSWAGFYEDEGFFHLSQHYMALRNLPAPKIAIRTNSAAALTSLVRASDMVAVLISPLARAACGAGLSDLRLAEPLWEMPVNIYYRQVAAELLPIRVFCEQVRERIRNLPRDPAPNG
ncbi:LysR family transcriptional regulator [Vannielia sp.]|uniref:LysR family transcriptional regulator n=1 Tax=Vannielia sp. TaxID=2813045 RepID=UPI002637A2A7|nr:LysR family transcriptional regulator [Vannielia sp.]MDF1871256.1 LysR family transcriptional regulator [Vannielia sp.]